MSALALATEAALGRVGTGHHLLRALLERPARELAEAALAQGPGARVDLDELFLHLFRHLGSPPEAVPFYLRAIRVRPEEVSDELAESVIRAGAPAVEPLVSLYEELGEEAGAEIAFLLARLGVRDDRILKVLLGRLDYDAWDAAFCLGLYGDPAALTALQGILAEIPAADADLRREFDFAVSQLGAPRSPLGPDTFDLFEHYPERALPAYEVLTEGERLELLADSEADVRAGAAESFFGLELSRAVRTRLLEAARADQDAAVRGRAWEALGDDKTLHAEMIEALADPARPIQERGGAAVGLCEIAVRPDVRTYLEALYDAGGHAREKALEAMWRSGEADFAGYFPRHLADPDLEIRRQAVWGVGHLGIRAHAEELRPLFDHEDLRSDALFNYALSMPAEITRGRVRGLLRRIDQITTLSEQESYLVMTALDHRLEAAGLRPVFSADDDEQAPPLKAGRNDPCPCGSGKKFKKCCG